MRIAILADIHGNLEAFEQVLEDIRLQQVDTIVSLGDNIGYGADSEAVIRRIKGLEIISVMGNHEQAVCRPKIRKWFRKDAQIALDQAISGLSAESLEYICRLPVCHDTDDYYLVHGYPPESARFYLFQVSDTRLSETLGSMKQPVCFVGHTHQLRLIHEENGQIRSSALAPGAHPLGPQTRYIINAGSVGQPRDGDPAAKYLVWDTDTAVLDVRAVPYDFITAARKIIDAGIPRQFAQRLKGH